METPIRADQKVTGGSSNIPITRIGSAIIAHVRPDLFFYIKDNLLPTEICGTEIILPEFTDMKLTVEVPQTLDPTADYIVSGFTLAEYPWNDINAIKNRERAFCPSIPTLNLR